MSEAKPYQDTKIAWVTVVGAFFVHFLSAGAEKAFSVWFVEIQEVFSSSASATSGIAGINSAMRLLLGPVAVLLTSIFGLQKVVIFGGVLSLIGASISAISNSFSLLLFGYSFIYGFGLTLVFTPSLIVCTTYFKKRRSAALSVSLTGAGFGAFFIPTLVTYLLDIYGYDGAMLIFAAILMHVSISGALYYPIHEENNNNNKLENLSKRKTLAIQKFKHELQCGPLISDPWFMLFVTAFIFNMMGSGPVTTLIVDYCNTMDLKKEQAISLLAIEGAFQVVSRLFSGVLFDLKRFEKIKGYLWCLIILLNAITVFGICIVNSYLSFAFVMGFRGLFLAMYVAQQTLITADMVDDLHQDMINQAIGLAQFMKGSGTLLGSYISGSIKDFTGDYKLAFAFLGTMQMLGCLMACIAVFIRDRQKQRTINTNNASITDKELEMTYITNFDYEDSKNSNAISDVISTSNSLEKDLHIVETKIRTKHNTEIT